MGDDSDCGQSKNCTDGQCVVLVNCPDGLAWNKEANRCDWPDLVEDCDAEAFLGFKCPPLAPPSDSLDELVLEYEFYESTRDCQEYYLCIEGRPRRIRCSEDQAFNFEKKSCDDIENVSTCSPEVQQLGLVVKNARAKTAQFKNSARA